MHIYLPVEYISLVNTRVVNDTQIQSFETVSKAKIKVSKLYQKLKSKFRNSIKNLNQSIETVSKAKIIYLNIIANIITIQLHNYKVNQ